MVPESHHGSPRFSEWSKLQTLIDGKNAKSKLHSIFRFCVKIMPDEDRFAKGLFDPAQAKRHRDVPLEAGSATKYESEHMLYNTPNRLIRHFSPRWERELAENKNSNRIHVPFPKEPVKLVVGWMMAGDGIHIGDDERNQSMDGCVTRIQHPSYECVLPSVNACVPSNRRSMVYAGPLSSTNTQPTNSTMNAHSSESHALQGGGERCGGDN